MEPLQILGESRVIRGRLQAAVFMALQNVLGDRPRLVNRYVTVIQYGNAAQRMTGAVLVGLEILGVKSMRLSWYSSPSSSRSQRVRLARLLGAKCKVNIVSIPESVGEGFKDG